MTDSKKIYDHAIFNPNMLPLANVLESRNGTPWRLIQVVPYTLYEMVAVFERDETNQAPKMNDPDQIRKESIQILAAWLDVVGHKPAGYHEAISRNLRTRRRAEQTGASEPQPESTEK